MQQLTYETVAPERLGLGSIVKVFQQVLLRLHPELGECQRKQDGSLFHPVRLMWGLNIGKRLG